MRVCVCCTIQPYGWIDGWMCICIPIAIKLNGCVLFFVEVFIPPLYAPISIAVIPSSFSIAYCSAVPSFYSHLVAHFGFKMIFIVLYGIFPEITKNNFWQNYSPQPRLKKGRKFTHWLYMFFSFQSNQHVSPQRDEHLDWHRNGFYLNTSDIFIVWFSCQFAKC